MRKRLLFGVTFGALAMTGAVPLSDHFGIELPWALAASAAAGLVMGYVVSIMCDVFFGNFGETENPSQDQEAPSRQ